MLALLRFCDPRSVCLPWVAWARYLFSGCHEIRLMGLILRWSLAPILAGLPALAAAGNSAVILQYHHVSAETPPSTSVTAEQLRGHLDYLAEHGFAVLPLEEIVEAIRAGDELPNLCVALTFDDAYASVGEVAWPMLRERGWPFTVFVTTGGIDGGQRSYLTWEQLRAMTADEGCRVTFGAHSHSHDYLVRRREGESAGLWRERVMEDIALSCQRIEDELESACTLFAYPYGEYDLELREVVAGMDLIGFGQHSGPVGPLTDWLAAPRFPASGVYADLDDLATKLYSLPLPVRAASPPDPILGTGNARPVLRLEIAPADYRADALAAFASGLGAAEVRWIRRPKDDQESAIVEIIATADLPTGRSRYNVTAPQSREASAGLIPNVPGGVRYYWWSHLWVTR